MKVQSFKSLTGFIRKTENFLTENEVTNNLFWEVLRGVKKQPARSYWAGNIMKNGKIEMSAILTSSNYLLISRGNKAALHHLIGYCRRKKWGLRGVTGPYEYSTSFTHKWLDGGEDTVDGRRDFSIYESPKRIPKWKGGNSSDYFLKLVGDMEWPRARLWALQFASESRPKINGSAVVGMAKEMMKNQNLYFLQKKGFGTCGMAGFGRETPNLKVINLVYVPKELRNQKLAQKLILEVLKKTGNENDKRSILFSDYQGRNNLYQSIGFQLISTHSERMF
jgi:GNAT superfamily N-acetyltransferase